MFSSSKRRGKARDTSAKTRGQQAVFSAVEPLETRTMLSTTITYNVMGNSDTIADVVTPAGVNTFKANTLRAAVDNANAQPFPVVIQFNAASFPGGAANTITLTSTVVHPAATLTLGSITTAVGGHAWKFVGNVAKPITISGAGLHQDFIVGLGSPTEFDNLTIAHGFADAAQVEGGGILAVSNLTLSGDTFASNVAEDDGGAVFAEVGKLTVTNCTFIGNVANTGQGGAIATADVAAGLFPVITGSTFTSNDAFDNGGAIFNEALIGNSTFTVTNDTFTSNVAVNGGGGAIYSIGTAVFTLATTVTGSKFTSNVANSSDGGAIYSDETSLTVSTSSFTSDKAPSSTGEGGAIFSLDNKLNIASSTFTGDVASEDGGAVYFYGTTGVNPTITVTGSTFNNDSSTSDFGGAIYNEGAANTVFSVSTSTFTGDVASEGGGAIYSDTGSTGTLNLTTDKFSGNTAHFDHGGAVSTVDGNVNVTGSTFTNDKAISESGGGLYVDSGSGSLAVTNSSFSGEYAYGDGGGVYFDGDNSTFTNVTFTGNTAGDTSNGGGIYSDSASLTVIGSTFTNNAATDEGGAIYSDDTIADIESSTFTTNSASFGGGAIFTTYAPALVTVNASTFTGNTENNTDDGGAIYSDASEFELTLDVLTGNSTGGLGGGMYFDGGVLTINQTTFSANTATSSGGGVYSDTSTSLQVFNSTFNGNQSAAAAGGGVFFGGSGEALVANDTFFGNNALEGGGLALAGTGGVDSQVVTDSTIDGNTAALSTFGGGIFGVGVLLNGDIVAQNSVNGTPGTGADLAGTFDPASTDDLIGDGTGSGFPIGFIGGNYVGSNFAPIDPLLAPLANNGGPTQTQALETGSLAIGNNDNFAVYDLDSFSPTFGQDITSVDQRGTDRPQAQGFDIGAFQSIPGLNDHFVWITPATAIAGQPFSVTVDALTNLNIVDNTFNEPVTITSSDALAAGLPGPGTLVFNAGVASFMPTLNTVGAQTFTVTDTQVGTNTPPATSNPIIVSAPVVPVTPTINITNATAAAPTSGNGTVGMTFTVTLSAASASTVTVTYGTMQGTASSGHGDYVGVPAAVLTFAPGQTTKTITVQIKKATYPAATYAPPYTPSHPGVYFYVLLTNANNAILGSATGIGTITY